MVSGLDIRDVSVEYGSLRAVDEVSLAVQRGEVVALLGASGSGKSSLLRAIVGLEPLAKGTVAWDGVNVTQLPVHRRGFGLMFQDGQLFDHQSVGRNVAYGLRSIGRAERSARVAEMLDIVGLSGYDNRPISTLSGGQAQRVALARALAPRPRVLLLDEPLSALDRGLREHLGHVLATSLRATGTTAVMVTHDQDEAFLVADTVGVMADGKLVALDTPDALWRTPPTREVAEFLGYGPFLPDGDGVIGLGGRALVVDGSGDLPADVVARRFRRGEVELSVLLDGTVPATALDPSQTASAGDSVQLRLVTSQAIWLPA